MKNMSFILWEKLDGLFWPIQYLYIITLNDKMYRFLSLRKGNKYAFLSAKPLLL